MNYIYSRYGENDDILYPAFFERMKFVAQFYVVEKLFCISSGSFALARWRTILNLALSDEDMTHSEMVTNTNLDMLDKI